VSLTCLRTRNLDLVRSIVTHPKIWPNVIDDYSPPQEAWVPNPSESVCYVLVLDGNEALGVVAFLSLSHIIFEIHPLFFPETWWSNRAKAAALASIDWIWKNTDCQRIVGNVPLLKHRTKLRFPAELGMVQHGINVKSFMKNGQLVDQVEFGISRPQE
jgi:hypothetical protein